jgi:hypothetical protein
MATSYRCKIYSNRIKANHHQYSNYPYEGIIIISWTRIIIISIYQLSAASLFIVNYTITRHIMSAATTITNDQTAAQD